LETISTHYLSYANQLHWTSRSGCTGLASTSITISTIDNRPLSHLEPETEYSKKAMNGALVVLNGYPGVGKTAIANELL
jgi:ATP-dependent Lon protease